MADVVEQLKAQGFGVLSDIDVQATLKAKLGADMPPYRILGACNPSFAHQALQIEDSSSAAALQRHRPRNRGPAREVASIDPVVSMDRTGNAALASTADEVRQRLASVIEAVASKPAE